MATSVISQGWKRGVERNKGAILDLIRGEGSANLVTSKVNRSDGCSEWQGLRPTANHKTSSPTTRLETRIKESDIFARIVVA
jgi:hypothetical protein